MKSLFAASVALAVSTIPGFAGEWQTEEDKGIFLHTLQEGTARLEMVCDPEGIWMPPEFHVLVTEGGQFMEGNTVEVSTKAETLTYPLSGGSILGATPEVWNQLVSALSEPGTVTFSTPTETVAFNIENRLTADCDQQ